MPHPLAGDLDHVLDLTRSLWEELRGERLFLTGGTGFFGCWLLESFLWANDRLGLGTSVTVLTRDPAAFSKKAPHLAQHAAVTLHEGDMERFAYPVGRYSHIVHAATDCRAALDTSQRLRIFDSIVAGTRRMLDFASVCGASKLLLTSSGAVYGPQPAGDSHLSETYAGAPDPAQPASAYGEGKRVAEFLAAAYAGSSGLEVKIARCFAFVGPYLPLDANYAIGNFIGHVLNETPLRIEGDGTPYRSYLYASDLVIWLWTILFRGVSGRAYNVGSEEAISISALAAHTARAASPELLVTIGKKAVPSLPPQRYVPSTARARQELGLAETVDLPEGIARTIGWHRWISEQGGIRVCP